MDDKAAYTRVIRLNAAAGTGMLAVTGVAVVLAIAGILPDLSFVSVAFGLATGSLALWTARAARRDRDDPAGSERRFQQQAANVAAVLVVVALVLIGGIIAWGLLR